jgi:hypothetical protein
MQFVLGMRWQAGVSGLEAMGFEELGDVHGIRLLSFDADGEGLDASEKQPRVEWGKTAARRVYGKV